MRSAFGIEHGESISKAKVPGQMALFDVPKNIGSAPRPGSKTRVAPVPGTNPTPDPSKAGAVKYLTSQKIKKNPLSYVAGAGAAGAGGGYMASNRNKYRGY